MLFLALAVYLTGFLQATRLHRCRTSARGLQHHHHRRDASAGASGSESKDSLIAWIAGTAISFSSSCQPHAATGCDRVESTCITLLSRLRPAARSRCAGLAILEINAYVGRFFASLLAASPLRGPVAVLDYAYEVVQAPAGFSPSRSPQPSFRCSPVMPPPEATADLRTTASLALRTVLFVNPSGHRVGSVLRVPLVALIFQRGQFTPQATEASRRHCWLCGGLPAIAGSYGGDAHVLRIGRTWQHPCESAASWWSSTPCWRPPDAALGGRGIALAASDC